MIRRFALAAAAALGVLAACETAPDAPPGRPDAALGEACGGMLGVGCADAGAFCDYPTSAQCGAADQMGVCAERPDACTREYRPVCGCDGETYSNACTAASAGVSVVSDGACSDA